MKPKDIYKTICYTFLIQSIAGFQTQGPSSVLARRRSSLGIHFVRTAPVFRPVLSATARLATDDGSSSSPAASSCNKWLVSPWRLERRTKFLQSCDSKLRKLRDVLSKWTRILKRTVAILAISFMMTHAAMAVTGGRVGGSFGKSSSSSSSSRYSSPGRVYSRPRYNYRSYGAPSVYYSGPPTTSYFFSTPRFVWGSPSVARVYADSAIQTRVSPTDVLLLTGTTALLAYGFYNNNKAHRDDTSPLGPGASVASIVLSLNVPDQNESNSVLSRLRSISEAAQTGSRQGVQDLVTEVCLELSRREQSMVSAVTDSRSYSSVSQAESAFRVQSLRNRSRLDRESVNKYGGIDRSDLQRKRLNPDGPKATSAVVSINIAIEGDSTKLPRIRDRRDVLDALAKLAADAQVEDCLLSAEILWSPDEPGEVLSANDIYADYPDLVPL